MRNVQVRVVLATDDQRNSFFNQLDEVMSIGKIAAYICQQGATESGHRTLEIAFKTDLDVGVIRLILGQSWTVALDVFCPDEPIGEVKRRKRRKRDRRRFHQKTGGHNQTGRRAS